MDQEVFKNIKNMLNTKISEFSSYAIMLHDSTNQKFDDKPYSFHLKRVASYVDKYGYLIAKSAADIMLLYFGAYFHDTIEDARVTYNDVLRYAKFFFNEEDAINAVEIVYALTNEKGRNRAERANEKYYEGIRNTKFAPFIKLCDRLANGSYAVENHTSMSKAYNKEIEHFINSIYTDETKKEVPYEMISELKSYFS